MRLPINFPAVLAMMAAAALAVATPLEFGIAEVNSAIASRNLKWKIKTEISLDAPESYRIEPGWGGGSISGGDIRGLMYGLLDAAEQIRTSGKLTRTRLTPRTPLRGLRLAITPDLEQESSSYWRTYFQMLARNRFNRIHVIPPSLGSPYRLEKLMSQLAADYGVDYTLGIETEITGEALSRLLASCPMIRSVAIGSKSASREAVFAAVRGAGRRIALDFDGVTTIFDAASEKGVPVVRPISQWPPSFEIDAPMNPQDAEAHASLYWLWGRMGYDPKVKLPSGSDAKAFAAGYDLTLMLGAADQTMESGSDVVASLTEAAENRKSQHASAKLTPLDIATRLDTNAAELDQSGIAEFKILAAQAKERAMALREAYQSAINSVGETSAEAPRPSIARPQWTHKVPSSPTGTSPLNVSLKLQAHKEIRAVRLHYRTLDPASQPKALEMPASNEVTFSIPAEDLAGNWDVFYYFEILHTSGAGWFEPDPLTFTPFFTVHINAPRVGPN
ncbi:MAG: hypothetical protein ABL967_08735 [Bryobacteraceae bacterium]